MKLDLNIVRDCLLDFEELHQYPKILRIYQSDDMPRCQKYDFDLVLYHLWLLRQAEYIDWHPHFADGRTFWDGTSENGITFSGQEFLNTVRGEKVWSQTQTIIKGLGSFSIDIVKDIASKVLTNLITGSV